MRRLVQRAATALVHEAYARLIDADVVSQDRVHFFAVSAPMLRRIQGAA